MCGICQFIVSSNNSFEIFNQRLIYRVCIRWTCDDFNIDRCLNNMPEFLNVFYRSLQYTGKNLGAPHFFFLDNHILYDLDLIIKYAIMIYLVTSRWGFIQYSVLYLSIVIAYNWYRWPVLTPVNKGQVFIYHTLN